jgi:signal transduction histidine kinase
VLKHPVAFAVFTGVVVEVTSLGAGLLLMRAHGNGWPWWFHGIVIASITGFMAGLITWLYTREMRHHDITRSKLAEESLRNSEKLAVAGRMAATVAHEINNPLEAVTDALYLLAESPSLDNSARQFLTIAQDELAKIRQIAILTLGLYRGDAERPQQVKVPELIDNVLSLYGRKLLRTLGVSIETRYDTDVTVNAFPGELQQVFSNLIVNAADAFEKSGGKLFIHVSESLDWTNLTQRGLRITISDNGCGIPVEKRAHIFEPFFTTKGSKGTGIGLWVSHGIVRKYGGTMRFRSVVKQGRSGTTFSIFLPVTQLA